jgi:hypothetical protein
MKAYMDDLHFERGGSEVHMRKRSRTMSLRESQEWLGEEL